MFTGIVEEVGRVRHVESRGDVVSVEIEATHTRRDLPIGGSIAVSGCCLTAVRLLDDGFVCELTPETLARTRFGAALAPGLSVNLERPLRADGRFDGHIVQGHVDGVGRVVDFKVLGESAEIEIAVPAASEKYLVEKGSVSVEGVSLTVARLSGATFTVALIPHTLASTNLRGLRAGDSVNLEYDVIAKYVERLLGWRGASPPTA
jgi:riboflavin synthase